MSDLPAWRQGDPGDLLINMRIVVCDEEGRIRGATVLDEHGVGDMSIFADDDDWRPLEWRSSWLWMRVPTRWEHFSGRGGDQ